MYVCIGERGGGEKRDQDPEVERKGMGLFGWLSRRLGSQTSRLMKQW